jgi:4-hydroxybenzoate polyprenyltransferase
VTAAVALVAGGGPTDALRLGLAMTAIQFAIGALNDIVDAPRDLGRADKPIPSGAVGLGLARATVVAGFAVGLGLSATFGPTVLAVALAGAAVGVAYDVGLKGTPWAPVAFAIGLPLLPVYAWLGATGGPPPGAVVLIPAAALAGIGLAVGNALVDVERDQAAGTVTPATVLGPSGAWRMAAVLHGGVVILALGSLVAGGLSISAGAALAGVGAIVIVVGLAIGRSGPPARRERGWELQAVGVGVLAAGWLWAVVSGPA